MRELALLRDGVERDRQSYTDILAQTTTGADGRFAFKDIAAQPMKISPSNIYRFPWSVVVISKGRGVVWHNFKLRNEQDLTLVMRPGAVLPRSIDGQRAEVGGGRARADQHD